MISLYKFSLQFCCQRFSNNSHPEFTDEERILPSICSVAILRDTLALSNVNSDIRINIFFLITRNIAIKVLNL